MAKGQAVVLPTTLKVKASKNVFPSKVGRPPSETFLAFVKFVKETEAERLADIDDDGNVAKYSDAKGLAITGTDEQEAAIRYLRRAASELKVGIRTAISEDGQEVMFMTKPMRASTDTNGNDD